MSAISKNISTRINLSFVLTFLFITTSSFAKTYTVEGVIAGDMLTLTNGATVRLIGIDTPESAADAKREGLDEETIAAISQQAKEYLADYISRIPDKKIILEFDVEKKDKYFKPPRMLAYVFRDTGLKKGDLINIKTEKDQHYDYYDGKYMHFINATMVKSGYATAMIFQPNVKYAKLFERLHAEAKEQKKGMWREPEPFKEEKEFYEDGTLKLHMVIYNEINSEGFWREYHKDGSLKIEAGLLKVEGGCSDDEGIPMEGTAKEYYENGRLKMVGEYKDNCEEGVHSYYTAEGVLEQELSYEGGKHLWTKRYNEDGKGYVFDYLEE